MSGSDVEGPVGVPTTNHKGAGAIVDVVFVVIRPVFSLVYSSTFLCVLFVVFS